ncbi:MAG: hypothetical protein JZU67_04085, partial [Burkholderiaceae bacterium]|nr:hypothetical protein [Burkholderiaceae bacterium]
MKAVELYLNVFLKEQKNGQKSESPRSNVNESDPSVEEALERMKNLLNLRHYSSRTLQTYTEWVQR